MKTKLLLSGILLQLFGACLVAQERHPLTDAIKYATGTNAEKHEIINAYKDIPGNDISNNKLIKDLIPKTEDDAVALAAAPDDKEASASSAALPVLDPSTVADALGTLIAERFKEELTIAFLNNFREKLKNDPYLGSLLPNTKNVMMVGDPFNYKLFLVSLRSALEQDLKEIPQHFPVVLNTLSMDTSAFKDEKVRNALKTVSKVYTIVYPAVSDLLQSPNRSYQALSTLFANIEADANVEEPMKGVLKMSGILMKELGNKQYNGWASIDQLEQLVEKDVARLFLSFIVEKHNASLKTIKPNSTTTTNILQTIRGLDSDKILAAGQYVIGLQHQIILIQRDLQSLRNKQSSSKLAFADFSGLLQTSLNLVMNTVGSDELYGILSIPKPPQFDQMDQYLEQILTFTSTLQSDIEDKAYGKIVVTSLNFLKGVLPDSVSIDGNETLTEFTKYVDFAISLASAENAQDLVNVLESVALPTQSYRLKQNSFLTATVNAYGGLYLGHEWLRKSGTQSGESTIFGFTAPIGIALSTGLTQKKPGKYNKTPMKTTVTSKSGKTSVEKSRYFSGNSISLFISAIDVGTITALRLKNTETPVSNIQWKNIFAPGVHLVWGMFNSPVSLGAGFQYGPELRKIEVTAADMTTNTIQTSAFRFNVNLMVDIPIFSLYSKSEKVRKKEKKA